MAFWIPIAMAAASAAKAATVDAERERRQRKLAAETQRYSPWTGMQAGPVQEADVLGGAIQGGAAGLGMMQNMDMASAQKEYMKAATNRMNAGAPAPVIAPPATRPVAYYDQSPFSWG